jgi:hypothetical protein
VAESFTLNQRQSIALQLICRQLDRMRQDDNKTPQVCQSIGGERGTGKSRVVAAMTSLFVRTGQSQRLLLVAMPDIAAANINRITIHSAGRFYKDTVTRVGRAGGPDGFASSGSAVLCIDGQTRMDWQEKQVLVIDQVSMLSAWTLHAVNNQLCRLRESVRDFGGILIVIFCGDFPSTIPCRGDRCSPPASPLPGKEILAST